MPLPWRDAVGTLLVALSFVIYAAWAIGTALLGFGAVSAVAFAVLVLGVAASVSAVVPGFAELIRGSRLYLVTASKLGVIALIGGLWALAAGEALALGFMMLATILLWALSTARHIGLLRPGRSLGQG